MKPLTYKQEKELEERVENAVQVAVNEIFDLEDLEVEVVYCALQSPPGTVVLKVYIKEDPK